MNEQNQLIALGIAALTAGYGLIIEKDLILALGLAEMFYLHVVLNLQDDS